MTVSPVSPSFGCCIPSKALRMMMVDYHYHDDKRKESETNSTAKKKLNELKRF
jgi:hypothetical protein